MPVIDGHPYFKSCEELISSGGGTAYTIEGRREYVRKFRVVTKAKDMGAISVCLSPGLPMPGNIYLTPREYDLLALAVEFSAEREHQDDPFVWVVSVRYSTQMPPGGFPEIPGFGDSPTGAANNPEAERPEIDWDYEVVDEAPHADLDNKPFVNACDKPFKPAPTFKVCYNVLSITRNELGFNKDTASKYAMAVNSDKFAGCPPGTVLCYPPKAKMMFRGTIAYWRVSYRLKFGYIVDDGEDEDWIPEGAELVGRRSMQPRILNSGAQFFKEVPVAGGPPPKLTTNFEEGGSSQVLLTPDGLRLPREGKPNYRKFRVYRSISFADILTRGAGARVNFGGG